MSLKRKSRNSTLMTRNYLDLGSACGYYSDLGSYAHQYATFAALSFNVSHFSGKPEMASWPAYKETG